MWTFETLFIYFSTIIELNDRRYAEIASLTAKALDIEKEASKSALDLQRSTQNYKDEKANELREQINRERVLYATQADLNQLNEKLDVKLDPILKYVSSTQGHEKGTGAGWAMLLQIVTLIVSLISIVTAIVVVVLVITRQ